MNLNEGFKPVTEYKFGWQLDTSSHIPRLVYRKSDGLCYFYSRNELREHFYNKCLTNLEYLEGEQFCREIKFQDAKITALLAVHTRDEYHVDGADIVITNR